jgi:hypothetical protein
MSGSGSAVFGLFDGIYSVHMPRFVIVHPLPTLSSV